MNKYGLKIKLDKSGEVINTTKAQSLEEAIEYFSSIKKIRKDVFLDIFEVFEIIK